MMGLGVKHRAECEKCVLCMCVCVNFFLVGEVVALPFLETLVPSLGNSSVSSPG